MLTIEKRSSGLRWESTPRRQLAVGCVISKFRDVCELPGRHDEIMKNIPKSKIVRVIPRSHFTADSFVQLKRKTCYFFHMFSRNDASRERCKKKKENHQNAAKTEHVVSYLRFPTCKIRPHVRRDLKGRMQQNNPPG